MAKRINYDDWSREELIKELRRIKETTYGLVWHEDLPVEPIHILINPDARTPNELFPNAMAGKPFPILRETKSREIRGNETKPVNLLFKGDNHHSPAVLNFTHQEAIDLIYIDPPYNTGKNDFTYNDRFVEKEDPFRHSKSLSFMEKRLQLARHLLKRTVAILIIIDDDEQSPLRMLCDKIFEEKHFVATIIWQMAYSPKTQSRHIPVGHEYILVFAKDIAQLNLQLLPRTEKMNARYTNPDNDPRGDWTSWQAQEQLARPFWHSIKRIKVIASLFFAQTTKTIYALTSVIRA